MAVRDDIVALDLFAGVGWGVALQDLGITEKAVETSFEVSHTRTLNSLSRPIFSDVWMGVGGGMWGDEYAHLVRDLEYQLLIASPPCQTFSSTGNGSGRGSLEAILAFLWAGDYSRRALDEWCESFGGDFRDVLVLLPMLYIGRDRPEYIAMEQVPSVLPVFDAYAYWLRTLGYAAESMLLNAEEFGVPQTRKRAFLLASRTGEVGVPTPTHNRYQARLSDGGRDYFPDLKPWVSMADALGETSVIVGMRSNYGTQGVSTNRGIRAYDRPAPTITSKSNRNKWMLPGELGMVNVSTRDAATLQTFPDGFQFTGKKNTQHEIIGNAVPPLLAEKILEVLLAS